jgi:hypothetical protein
MSLTAGVTRRVAAGEEEGRRGIRLVSCFRGCSAPASRRKRQSSSGLAAGPPAVAETRGTRKQR